MIRLIVAAREGVRLAAVCLLAAAISVSAQTKFGDDAPPLDVPIGKVQAVRVVSVLDNPLRSMTAHRFGMQTGDVIFAIDGKPVTTAEQFDEIFDAKTEPNAVMEIAFVRNGVAALATNRVMQADAGVLKHNMKPMWGGKNETATVDFSESLAGKPVVRVMDGLRVTRVWKDFLGERAGVKPGDVVMSVNGKDVGRLTVLEGLLVGLKDGDPIDLLVLRDGKPTKLTTAAVLQRSGFTGRAVFLGVKGDATTARSEVPTRAVRAEERGAGGSQMAAAAPKANPAVEEKSAGAGATENAGEAKTVASDAPKPAAAAPVSSRAAGEIPKAVFGMRVTEALHKRPAEAAGLRKGDVIESLNDKPVHSLDEMIRIVLASRSVAVRYIRDGQAYVADIATGGGLLGVRAEPAGAVVASGGWPTFPEIGNGAGWEAQDLHDQLRAARAEFEALRRASPVMVLDYKDSAGRKNWMVIDKKGRIKGDLPCSAGGAVDIYLPARQAAWQSIYVRLLKPECTAKGNLTSKAFAVKADGTWSVGTAYMNKDDLDPNVLASVSGNGNLVYLASAPGSTTMLATMLVSDGTIFTSAEPGKPLDASSRLRGRMTLRNAGVVDGEVIGYQQFDISKSRVLTSDKYTLTTEKFGTVGGQIVHQGSTRIDTKAETALGPAGTYYFGGLHSVYSLPDANEVVPGPLTLASHAEEAASCAYKPKDVPEGFILWAKTCTADSVAAVAADGTYGLVFNRGAQGVLTEFDPEHPGMAVRQYKAMRFTATNPPLPLGETEVYDGTGLAFRGSLAGFEPEGDGRCGVDGSTEKTEACTFREGRRVDVNYVARMAQAKLDEESKARAAQASQQLAQAAQQRDAEAAAAAEEARRAAAERAAEERRAKRAKSDAMWGAVMGGLQTFNNEMSSIAATQAAQAAAAERRTAALRAAQVQQQSTTATTQRSAPAMSTGTLSAAQRRQQVSNINAATERQTGIANNKGIANNTAMQRALEQQKMAAQQQRTPPQSATSAKTGTQARVRGGGSQALTQAQVRAANGSQYMDAASTNMQKAAAETQAGRASAGRATSTNSAASTPARGSMSTCISDARDFCMPGGPQAKQGVVTAQANTREVLEKPENVAERPASSGLHAYPEVLMMCKPDFDEKGKAVLACIGSRRQNGGKPAWDNYAAIKNALYMKCVSGHTPHDYGKHDNYLVWGCGYGVDASADPHTREYVDLLGGLPVNLPERRVFHCDAGVIRSSVCTRM